MNKKDPKVLVTALAEEFEKIEGVLAKAGYSVIKIDLECVQSATREGELPDLQIWARPTEKCAAKDELPVW
jgi:hypothetical protein